MGIWHQKPPWLGKLADRLKFTPPDQDGLDAVEAIRAMRDGTVKVFMGVGGNLAAAGPDTAVTEAALRSCALTVHVATKLNRSHVVPGETALLLPCLGRTEVDRQVGGEQFVTVEDSMSCVHASRGSLAPASPMLRSEVAIVCGIAQATLGPDSPIPWSLYAGDYRAIREEVAAVVPGFADYESKVLRKEGFTVPQGPRDRRQFDTSSKRAEFTVNACEFPTVPPGRLMLQTIRSHDQYNTTIYGLDDRYRGIKNGRRVIFVHPDDLTELGFADGDLVDIISEWTDGSTRRAQQFRTVAYPTARGCAAAYFPEANVLVPLDSTAKRSNQPASKEIVVRLESAAE
jgi:molybdopterin-dependent oxidoreductase alpha subunit